MNAKDIVFGVRDLFHRLLDFLPGLKSLPLRAVAKSWKDGLKYYRLPNFDIDLSMVHRMNIFRDGNLNPCSVMTVQGNRSRFPANKTHLIYKLIFQGIIGLRDCLCKFSNVRDLTVGINSLGPEIIPQSVRILKIVPGRNLYYVMSETDYYSECYFDGSKLENVENLDVSQFMSLIYDHVKLPPNLQSLRMWHECKTFPAPGYLPSTLRSLYFNSVKGEILPGSLPPNLEHLEIISGFEGPITDNAIPASMRFLQMGRSFDSKLVFNAAKLRTLSLMGRNIGQIKPLSITTLKIDNRYSRDFDAKDLPPTLTELEISASIYTPLETENLPYSLIALKINVYGDYCPQFFKLPPCLRKLHVIFESKVTLIPNDLPESITDLTLEINASIELCKGILPPNLRTLYISYDPYMYPESFPHSLKTLDLPHYCRSFKRGVLPPALTSLSVSSGYSLTDFGDSWFPDTLDYIDVGEMKIAVPRRIG
jgi:hypothetical protein